MGVIHLDDEFTEGDAVTFTCTGVDLDGTTLLGDLSSATVELIYWFEGKPKRKLTGSGTAASVMTAKFNTAGGAPSGIPDSGLMHILFYTTDGTDPFHATDEYTVKVRPKPNIQSAA